MSTAIKDSDLSGETIRYGDVEIGGSGGPVVSGTTIKSTPPQSTFAVTNIYDDASRTVIAHRVRLNSSTIFFSETASLSANQLEVIRKKLMEPRQLLYLAGTGSGFDDSTPDIGWGPRPITCTIEMHGKITASVNWVVDFEIAPCDVTSFMFSERFKSFVFSQTYSLDDEGMLTRVTQGTWEVAPQLPGGSTQIADQFRELVSIEVPNGFQRLEQNYQESPDKSRMELQVVDTQLRGDALPPFIIRGTGNWSMASKNVGFTEGSASLRASMTVAPGVPPHYASLQFFLMAQQKFDDLVNSAGGQIAVIPMTIAVDRGLWANSRTTNFQMTWTTTGCLAQFLNEGFWNPLDNSGDWQAWSQSIAHTWHQRGVAGIASNPNNDDRINLCTATSQVVIETPEPTIPTDDAADGLDLICPNIDPQHSWLSYEVEVKFLRDEKKSYHKQAVNPFRSTTAIADPIYGTNGIEFGESFDPTGNEDVVEETGIPEQYVLIKARGLRVHHPPVFPVITEIDGQPVEEYGKPQIEIGPAFNVGCIVYKMRGYRIYKVKGNVTSLKSISENPVICGSGEEESTP